MLHAPAVQLGVPFCVLHAFAQLPQFVVLVFRFASQPSEASPLQLPQPASHAITWHVPDSHDSVAFARLHALPQAPQFWSDLSGVSQPVATSPSQLP
jgi:hypothetical protein